MATSKEIIEYLKSNKIAHSIKETKDGTHVINVSRGINQGPVMTLKIHDGGENFYLNVLSHTDTELAAFLNKNNTPFGKTPLLQTQDKYSAFVIKRKHISHLMPLLDELVRINLITKYD